MEPAERSELGSPFRAAVSLFVLPAPLHFVTSPRAHKAVRQSRADARTAGT